jgi:hypothetical protein
MSDTFAEIFPVVLVQLCKAMKGQQAEHLRLPSDALKRFRYLNRSGCTFISGTDDAADFHLVQSAMDAVNIDKKSQASHYRHCHGHSSCRMMSSGDCGGQAECGLAAALPF